MKKLFKVNRNSWKHRIYVYCIIVFLLPILVILGLNINSMNIIKKQTMAQNQHVLEHIADLMDNAMSEIRGICIEIASMREVYDYAAAVQKNPGKHAYKRYELTEKLKAYKKEKVGDVFVYFPQDDYVVSGVNGAYIRKTYGQIYYDDTIQMFEDFYNKMDDSLQYPSLFALDKNGVGTKIGVSIKCEINDSYGSFVVVCILDEEYLEKNIFNLMGSNRSDGLIFGENRELIFSRDRKGGPYDLFDFTGETSSYEDSFEQASYMMQVIQSEVIDAYYGLATPTNVFWAQLLEMRVLSTVSIIICVLAGVILIAVFSKKLYEPLGTVVQMLKKHNRDTENVIEDISEFFFLERKFIELSKKKKDEEYALKEKKKRLQEEYLWNLVGEKNEYKGEEQVFFSSDYFAVGVFVIEDSDKEKTPIYHFVIDNVFEEIFNRTDQGYVLNLHNQDFFIINLKEPSCEHLIKMLEEGKTFLERSGISISIGHSDIHEGISELPIAYQEGLEAISYRFLHGKGRLLSYEITKNREEAYLNEARVDIYSEISQYLDAGMSRLEPEGYVFGLFERNGINAISSFAAVECFKFDVVSTINRLGIRYGSSIEERKAILGKLLEAETLDEFKQLLSRELAFLLEKKETWKRENAICLKVREYVNKNYHDEQLSVVGISKHIGLSPSYLSKLYKEAYGITVAYEISEVRLNRAKELLVNSEISIEEIASRTGFSNISVFTKAFKKQLGIPPGKYRQENRCM